MEKLHERVIEVLAVGLAKTDELVDLVLEHHPIVAEHDVVEILSGPGYEDVASAYRKAFHELSNSAMHDLDTKKRAYDRTVVRLNERVEDCKKKLEELLNA